MKDKNSDDIFAVLNGSDEAKILARIREEIPEDGVIRDDYSRSMLKYLMDKGDSILSMAVVHRSSPEALTTPDDRGFTPIESAIHSNTDRELVEAMARVIGREKMAAYEDRLKTFMGLDIQDLFTDSIQVITPKISLRQGRNLPA